MKILQIIAASAAIVLVGFWDGPAPGAPEGARELTSSVGPAAAEARPRKKRARKGKPDAPKRAQGPEIEPAPPSNPAPWPDPDAKPAPAEAPHEVIAMTVEPAPLKPTFVKTVHVKQPAEKPVIARAKSDNAGWMLVAAIEAVIALCIIAAVWIAIRARRSEIPRRPPIRTRNSTILGKTTERIRNGYRSIIAAARGLVSRCLVASARRRERRAVGLHRGGHQRVLDVPFPPKRPVPGQPQRRPQAVRPLSIDVGCDSPLGAWAVRIRATAPRGTGDRQ